MVYINWSKKYSINYPAIDDQHKTLVAMLNQLDESIRQNHGENTIAKILISLSEYTHYHFSDEEKLMQKIDFPEYEKHKILHDNLRKQLKAILLRMKKGKSFDANELFDFLLKWLLDHILAEDKKIGILLAQKVKERI